MPSTTSGAPYVNEEPPFTCCQYTSDALPWPSGTQLRVRLNPAQNVHEEIEPIIKASLDGWKAGLHECLSFRWVEKDESADIRINFNNAVSSWSARGAHARSYDANEGTMNISFGGWKTSKAVFSHAWIRRAATHLFGHALGL
jgi:hypothetical protein